MRRRVTSARPDWREKVEAIGLTFHTHEKGPYWDEAVHYEFTAQEIDTRERATNELHRICIEAAQAVVDNAWWDRLAIPESAIPLIQASWDRDDFSLYGRFDLAWDGRGTPKLLEYNADTPTALIEASVAQWFWLQDLHPQKDQFNSIHERLIEAWLRFPRTKVHFASMADCLEDQQTVLYLQDTCQQAGKFTEFLSLGDIGWDAPAGRFVDMKTEPIAALFKLYPWEWLLADTFAQYIPNCSTAFLEPAWKMLFSNKGLLPVLWELNPGHDLLLPAYESPEPLKGNYVRKPKLSREGANITLVSNGSTVIDTGGEYGEEGYVFQGLAGIHDFDGQYPVIGTWVVDHEAAGMGIREDSTPITGNLSRFVPHLFEPA